MRLHWYQSKNFGDALSPRIVEKLSGEKAIWSSMPCAEIVAIGSVLFGGTSLFWNRAKLLSPKGLAKLGQKVLDCLQPRLTIWGSGFLFDEGVTSAIKVRNFDVRAVRGKNSLEILKRLGFADDGIALGDPGLLFPMLLDQKPETKYDVGIVPHFSDKEAGARKAVELAAKGMKVKLVDVLQDDPLETVREIGECAKILSSSLHGLVTADAFGIPREHVWWGTLGQTTEQAKFKFEDYESVAVSPMAIEEAKGKLLESFPLKWEG